MFTILETKCFQIYNIHDAMVEFLVEEDTILLSALLERNGIGKPQSHAWTNKLRFFSKIIGQT